MVKIKVLNICMELHKEGIRTDTVILAEIDKTNKAWFKSLRNDYLGPSSDCVVYPGNYQVVS